MWLYTMKTVTFTIVGFLVELQRGCSFNGHLSQTTAGRYLSCEPILKT